MRTREIFFQKLHIEINTVHVKIAMRVIIIINRPVINKLSQTR